MSNGCICWWNCDPDLLLVSVGVKNVVMGMCITIIHSHWVVLNVNMHLGYYHCIIIAMPSVVVNIYNLIQIIGVKIYQWKHVNPHNHGYFNGLYMLCLIILKLFLCCHQFLLLFWVYGWIFHLAKSLIFVCTQFDPLHIPLLYMIEGCVSQN